MTTFTRIQLNPSKRSGRKLLVDPQSMHAAVRAAFPPDLDERDGRVLWRVDSSRHDHVLYIVAPEPPETGHLIEQAGWATRPAQIADYAPLLDRLQRGQEWRFRLRANPVRSEPTPGGRGIIRPHVTVAQQTGWLAAKAANHGFELLTEQAGDQEVPMVAVTGREDLSFNRADREANSRRRVTLRTAQFDGVLRVTDRDDLRAALVNGIGRGKAYGCGLLTLQRLSG